MKKNTGKKLQLLFAAFSLSLGGLVLIAHQLGSTTPIVTKAWSGTQTSTEGSYYSSISDSLTGSALISALNSRLSSPTPNVSYDWSRYEAADEMEGDSTKVLQIYARTPVAKSAHVSGSSGWNREHTYPQSKLSITAAEDDNHIIFADDNKTNGIRGNNPFKDLNKTGTRVVDSTGAQTDNYTSGGYFEPNDAAKGEVARATLYTHVLYGKSITDNFDTTATAIEWALKFPITNRDIYRNNIVHTLQGNRNPFVDHPEYTCRIWGNTSSLTQSLCASIAEPTPALSINKTSANLVIDETVQLTVTATGGLSSNSATWTSSSAGIASVSSTGLVTAHSVGNATITAQSTVDTSITVTSQITVSTAPVEPPPTSGSSYLFTSKDWNATQDGTAANWYNGKAGLGYLNNGVQVSTGVSGAYGNSPVSFSNINSVTVSYATNATKGVGNIYVYIVSTNNAGAQTGTLIGSQSVSTTGGVTMRDLTFVNNTGVQNGYIQVYVECTTNSIYVGGASIATATASKTLTMSPTTATIVTGATRQLSVTASGGLASNSATWSSNTPSVATVNSNGLVSAVNPGTAIITATSTEDSSVTAFATITVEAPAKTLTNLAVNATNATKLFAHQDNFSSSGLVVTATYSDSSTEVIAAPLLKIDGTTVTSASTLSVTGSKTVVVSYTYGSVTLTGNYQIEVLPLTSIAAVNASNQKVMLGSVADHSGITAVATYSDSNDNIVTKNIANSELSFSTVDTSALGYKVVTITYKSVTTTFNLKVTNEGVVVGSSSVATDLFISEYIEGSGNNKGLEIYNGTGATVNLSAYSLKLYANGATTANNTLTLTGSLANGATYVIVNNSANAEMQAAANLINGSITGFNGDDAIELLKNDTAIDVVGIVGVRTNWTGFDANGNAAATTDNTLVRSASINQPNTTFTFGEWVAYSQDTTTNLGQHTFEGGSSGLSAADQANAYATYFLSTTANYCSDLNGGNVPWAELKAEYGFMAASSKDTFVNSTDSTVISARARYQYLIGKYSNLAADNFVVDGSNVPAFLGETNMPTMMMSTKLIAAIIVLGTGLIIGYHLLKNKKRA